MPELTFRKLEEQPPASAPQQGDTSFAKTEDAPSTLGALFRGFVQGFGLNPAMRPPSILPGAEAGRQRMEADVASRAAQASVAHPGAVTTGNVMGNVAATAPFAAAGGAPATIAGRLALAPAIGAGTTLALPGDHSLKETAIGAAGGAVGGAAGEILGSTLGKAIAGNTAQGVENYITNAFRKSVKPSRVGQQSAPQLAAQDQRIITAVDQIIENKPNLTLTDSLGQQLQGQAPRSLRQFAEAIDQTKSSLFREYDQMAQRAGQTGVRVDLKPAIAALQQAKLSVATQDFHPGVAAEADKLIQALSARGSYSPSEAQDVIQNLNRTLSAYWKNPTRETVSQSSLLAPASRALRGSLDNAIETAQGPGYQAMRTRYGALRSVEKDVAGAVQREANKIPGGLGGIFTDLAASEEAIRGVITLNPGALVRAGTIKAAQAAIKHINSPNRAIQKMFEARSTPFASKTRQLIGGAIQRGASPVGAAGGGAASERMKAQRKVSDLHSELYSAKRRGDLAEVQKLNEQLAAAIGDYRKVASPRAG